LIREVAHEFKTDLKFTGDSMGLAQILAEDFLVKLFEDTNLVATHAGRVGILPKDMQLVIKIQQNHDLSV
jgi:histone H3